jgi:putative two-component system response regulator
LRSNINPIKVILKSEGFEAEDGRIGVEMYEDMGYNKEGKIKMAFGLQNAVLKTMVNLLEYRDSITGGHVKRTQCYLDILVDVLIKKGIYGEEVSRWDIDLLIRSSQLHDIGKNAIADRILQIPAPLKGDAFDEMKAHTILGVKLIETVEAKVSSAFWEYAKIFAGTHHEWWDGTGYPFKLSGEHIPLPGRLIAIPDVYDALTSSRPYKAVFSPEKAVKLILAERGTHFDPVLIDLFRLVSPKFRSCKRHLEVYTS